jgi:hypothetical protein
MNRRSDDNDDGAGVRGIRIRIADSVSPFTCKATKAPVRKPSGRQLRATRTAPFGVGELVEAPWLKPDVDAF